MGRLPESTAQRHSLSPTFGHCELLAADNPNQHPLFEACSLPSHPYPNRKTVEALADIYPHLLDNAFHVIMRENSR